MATQSPIVCPLCHSEMRQGELLRDHLFHEHSKQELSDLVVAEEEAKQMELDS